MGRYCDACHRRLDAGDPSVTATRQSSHRRPSAHATTTTVRSYAFHEACWDRVSAFGGYQRSGTTTAA